MTLPSAKLDGTSFMRTRGLIISDIIYCVGFLLLTLFLKSQIPLIVGFLLSFIYLKITRRMHFLVYLGIAFVMALAWVCLAKNNYHYGATILEIKGVCPFPIFAWGMGFFSATLLLSHCDSIIRNCLLRKVLLYTVLCSVLLVGIEYAAYHLFSFKNTATQNYNAIPFINCIHAPTWMQVMYFLLGPAYGVITHFVQNRSVLNGRVVIDQEENSVFETEAVMLQTFDLNPIVPIQ